MYKSVKKYPHYTQQVVIQKYANMRWVSVIFDKEKGKIMTTIITAILLLVVTVDAEVMVYANDEPICGIDGCTQNEPVILIGNKDGLVNLAASNLTGCYRLTENIDLEHGDWAPCVLNGHFFGDGYKISNVKINDDGTATVGFFGSIGSGGRVSSLALENISVEFKNDRCLLRWTAAHPVQKKASPASPTHPPDFTACTDSN